MVLTDQLGPCAGIPIHAAADDLGPVDLQGSYLPARESSCLGTAGSLAERASSPPAGIAAEAGGLVPPRFGSPGSRRSMLRFANFGGATSPTMLQLNVPTHCML